ncbi:TonB-dependent receptor [Desulfocicer niacini]
MIGDRMRKLMKNMVVILMGIMVLPLSCFSDETAIYQLPQSVVTGKFEEQDFVGPLFTETNTKTKVTEKGINALGPSSTMSVQKSISLMPSVNQQSVDPSGLADISNYHESFRFRGVEATGGGNPSTPVNVENVPVSGRPGGGVSIYDMENFETISIYKGGVPADKAFGLTNIGGKIDMEVKRPLNEFGVKIKQMLGTDDFSRSFLRLDTGNLSTDTAGFISYSNTSADKWRGKGDSDRDNAMAGLTQKIGDGLKIELFSTYNKADVNTYRTLNYEKASSLSKNYDLDFADDKNDYFYYGYNRADFEDYNIFGNIEYRFDDNSKVVIKPFYWNDQGYYMETITMKNGNNRIRRWDVDHDLSGFLSQYSRRLQAVDLNIGFFNLQQERPGPPTSWKLYKVSSSGLVFDKWQVLSNSSKHRQNTPFISGKYAKGRFTLEGGVKYLRYTMPSIKTYDTTGILDVSYETALGMATSVDEDACADAKDFNKILPNLGLNYRINDDVSAYFSYGRNYGMSVSLYPYFISQKSAFYGKGITLQDLWDEQELEIVDNYDIGLRYITDKVYVVPTLYYARHKNKAATYYDSALGVSFPATNAKADAYGFELEAGAMAGENLSLYGSFSYNRFFFSQDICNSDGSVNGVEGEQVPDAPEFLCKAIASYRMGKFVLSPMVKYTSSRYGDIEHDEKIDDAVIFDFDLTYNAGAFPGMKMKNLDFSLTVNNILDKEYVSIINTSDYKTLGSTYQTGAPFTVYASVTCCF